MEKEHSNCRNYSLDLLKIISMMMIIVLHFFSYSNVNKYIELFSINYFFKMFLTSVCLVSVNCYVLITGYFGENTKFKLSKVLKLLIEVLFYSIMIYFILLGTGTIKFEIKDLIYVFLPTLSREYWFVTSYVGLYIIAPFLKRIFQRFSMKEMYMFLFTGFCMLVVYYNFFFFTENLNFGGATGIVWFSYLYFIGMFMKKYKKHNDRKNIFYYIITLGMAIGSKLFFIILYLLTNKKIFLEGSSVFNSVYNSIFTFLCSIAFFNIFINKELSGTQFFEKILKIFSKSSFAVYLIHDNPFFRNILWNLYDFELLNTWDIVIYVIFVVLIIYITVVIIDSIVDYLFSRVLFTPNKVNFLENTSQKITELFNKLYFKHIGDKYEEK